jgi:hypothetical protein
MQFRIRNYLGDTSSHYHVAFATQDYTIIKDIVSSRKESERFLFTQAVLTRTQKRDNILAALIYLQTTESKHFFDQRRKKHYGQLPCPGQGIH